MRKISMVLLLIVVIFVPNQSFAGDIPEWLLQDEDTQTFVGEVKEMTEESVTLIQRYNIKGEFEEGSEQTYPVRSSLILEDVKVGETVLCGYADENNLYLYKIKKFENGRIELSDDYPMTKRLEEYINHGDFAKAEQKRLSGNDIKQAESKEETSAKDSNQSDIIGGADGPTSIFLANSGMVDIWKFVVGIGVFLVSAGVLLVKRQKRTR